MPQSDLYYAVTRIHSQESNLLSQIDLQQLLDTATIEDAFALLKNKGWGDSGTEQTDIHTLLEYEYQKTWNLAKELLGSVKDLDIFLLQHDFNNLKAAVKLAYIHETAGHAARYFTPFATLDTTVLWQAAETGRWEKLPLPFAQLGKAASDALLHTGNGQEADVLIDKTALEYLYNTGLATKHALIVQYVTQLVDLANIKIAVRSYHTNRGRVFLHKALAPVGSLNIPELEHAATLDEAHIYNYLEHTDYAAGIPALKESIPAFECWCDNRFMKELRPQRYEINGLGPIVGFLLARENEINMVRLVFSAKTNQLDTEKVRQRMREMYV